MMDQHLLNKNICDKINKKYQEHLSSSEIYFIDVATKKINLVKSFDSTKFNERGI